MSEIPQPRCPICHTLLRQIGAKAGEEEWLCPVALEAQRKGILGQPGRKHKEVWIYVRAAGRRGSLGGFLP